jgi:hypothetical protein
MSASHAFVNLKPAIPVGLSALTTPSVRQPPSEGTGIWVFWNRER